MIEGADTVLTFEPHPLEVLHPAALPKLIMPFSVKRDVIAGLGVEELVVIPFDEEFAQRSAEDFIEQVLVETLDARAVSVGENFRFGAKARGDAAMLASARRSSRPGSCRWSRSAARRSPRPGSGPRSRPATWSAPAAASAPRSWSRARSSRATSAAAQLGFPTANIVPDDRLAIPGHGIYAAFADGLPAAVNVGVRPTFESGRGVLIETYIIDHDEDLYGKTLRVAFVERLRGEHRFDDVEALVAQMRIDVEDARRVCASFQRP